MMPEGDETESRAEVRDPLWGGLKPNVTYFAKSDHRHHLVGRTPSSAAGPLAGSSMIAGA